MDDIFESTISDIFKKYDMLLTKEMSYVEFKGFFECLEKKITQKEYEVNVLQKYQSTKKGITLKGNGLEINGRVQRFLARFN